MSKNILVSFADGPFKPAKARFIAEARAMAVFDDIKVFDFDGLPYDFTRAHGDFVSANARGFGYWIWKPKVIDVALKASKMGDVVVYLDAGFTLNSQGRQRFLEYVDIARNSEHKMLSFQNIHTEYIWTKMDLAVRLSVDAKPEVFHTSQLSSGFLVIENTDPNRDLIKQWEGLAVEGNYRYSDDSPSVAANHPGFREHRHDQSISSLLRKLRGTAITHYEVQPYAEYFDNLKPVLPMWATRLRH